MHDEFTGHGVEHAHHRHLACLTRRFDTQVGTAFGPGMGEVRMGQRLGLIGVKQNDVTGPGLLAPDLETQSDAVDFVRVLPAFQRVSRAAPAKPPCILPLPAVRKPERLSVDGSPQPPGAIEPEKKHGAPSTGSTGNPNSRLGRESSLHSQGRVMEQPPTSPCFVGIDVSKDRLDVHVLPSGLIFAAARDGKGLNNSQLKYATWP